MPQPPGPASRGGGGGNLPPSIPSHNGHSYLRTVLTSLSTGPICPRRPPLHTLACPGRQCVLRGQYCGKYGPRSPRRCLPELPGAAPPARRRGRRSPTRAPDPPPGPDPPSSPPPWPPRPPVARDRGGPGDGGARIGGIAARGAAPGAMAGWSVHNLAEGMGDDAIAVAITHVGAQAPGPSVRSRGGGGGGGGQRAGRVRWPRRPARRGALAARGPKQHGNLADTQQHWSGYRRAAAERPVAGGRRGAGGRVTSENLLLAEEP